MAALTLVVFLSGVKTFSQDIKFLQDSIVDSQALVYPTSVYGYYPSIQSFSQSAVTTYNNYQYVIGVIRDGEGIGHSSLHANMFALAFGLVPEKYYGTVLSYIRSRGMACSVYGSQFLLDALYNAHESKDALKLLTSTDSRSWYNMIRSGSTITTEAWDMKYKPNQDWNHAWGAAPANIIVRKLMGVEPLTAAFEIVQIKPQPDTLGKASLSYLTLRGHIVVKFENTAKKFKLEIDLPANMSSTVYLPRKTSRSVIRQNGIEIKAIPEGKFWKINNIGSGNHEWEVKY